jgi:hypothetical protein
MSTVDLLAGALLLEVDEPVLILLPDVDPTNLLVTEAFGMDVVVLVTERTGATVPPESTFHETGRGIYVPTRFLPAHAYPCMIEGEAVEPQ